MKRIIQGDFCFLHHYCSCSCKQEIQLNKSKFALYERKGYPKFINHHNNKINHPFKGKYHTPESIEKNRKAHLGNKNALGHIPSEEQREKQRKSMLGKTSSMKGRKRSLESKLKQSEAMKGRKPCNSGLTQKDDQRILYGKNHPLFNIKRNEETRNQISESLKGKMSGENHWNWQDGKTSLAKQIRFSSKFDNWRIQIFERDHYTCRDCGIIGVNLHPHHIKYFSEILVNYNITTLEQALECKELWDLSNGKTVCKECHKKYPKHNQLKD